MISCFRSTVSTQTKLAWRYSMFCSLIQNLYQSVLATNKLSAASSTGWQTSTRTKHNVTVFPRNFLKTSTIKRRMSPRKLWRKMISKRCKTYSTLDKKWCSFEMPTTPCSLLWSKRMHRLREWKVILMNSSSSSLKHLLWQPTRNFFHSNLKTSLLKNNLLNWKRKTLILKNSSQTQISRWELHKVLQKLVLIRKLWLGRWNPWSKRRKIFKRCTKRWMKGIKQWEAKPVKFS